MTSVQAVRHLEDRARRTCDAIGNRGSGAVWSSLDVEAVHVLVRRLNELEALEAQVRVLRAGEAPSATRERLFHEALDAE